MVRSGVGRVIRQAEHLAQAGDLDEAHHGGRGMLDAQGTVLVTRRDPPIKVQPLAVALIVSRSRCVSIGASCHVGRGPDARSR